MPVTRGRAKADHSASATPTTAVSPMFSARTSTRSTPDTSNIDEDDVIPVKGLKTSSNANGKKRVLEVESEEERIVSRGAKRRVVKQTAYVEVPPKKTVKVRLSPCYL